MLAFEGFLSFDFIPALDVDEQIVHGFEEECVWTARRAATVYVPYSVDFKFIDIRHPLLNLVEPSLSVLSKPGEAAF